MNIVGDDFRKTMEGFDGEVLRVYFGEMEVEGRYIDYMDYKTIEVIAPQSNILDQYQ